MAVDETVLEDLADSQYWLEISPDGGTTHNKVELMLDSDMPESSRATDDITPTDAHNTHKVAVNFFETNDVNFTMVFNPSNTQHKAIKQAYHNNTILDCRLVFEDSRITGYGFKASLSKFTPETDPKKKLRYKGTLVLSGEIDHSVTSTSPTP